MAVKEKLENVSDEIEWTVDAEVQLFYAMHGHKPVGVNKFFQMACIVEKFRNAVNKDVSSRAIWNHLDTMYDMQALDDTENLPFPNDMKDFSLPTEFIHLIEEKKKSREAREVSVQDDKKVPVLVKKIKDEKRDGNSKEAKETTPKKDVKDLSKESKKDVKDSKEPKKIINKEVKQERRESKDDKEVKKDPKKDARETPKDIKKDAREAPKDVKKDPPEQKSLKPRTTVKEKKEYKKEEEIEDVSLASLSTPRKDRVRELSESRVDDSPKRGGKRSTRGSIKPDDTGSNKSSSPVTTATPPPMKRRRT